jgi:TonB family protein
MRVLQGILLSLLIHFFLAWSAQFAPLIAPRLHEKPVTVEIIEKDPSQTEAEKKQKQIVRETDIPDELKAQESEDPLAFFSGHTQRVKKQTQAAVSGMTKNRTNEPVENQKDSPQPPPEKAERQSSKSNLDPKIKGGLEAFLPKYRKAPKTPRVPRDNSMEKGLSTIGEALPKDVTVGSFTALNTDRYLYYSFFTRIEDIIRFRWESSVRDAIETTPPERLNGNVSGIWTTQLEIWIKRNGELDSTHVMKESGFKSFDRAAVQAFVQARMFPNPPEEMVESDGLIHLKYSFQVRYEPKVLSKSSD